MPEGRWPAINEKWDEAHGATPPELPDTVFFLEASLIHARATVDLLLGGSHSVDHLRAGLRNMRDRAAVKQEIERRFGTDCDRVYGDLSSLLAHLSARHKYIEGEVEIHEPGRLAAALIAVLRDFYQRPGNYLGDEVDYALNAAISGLAEVGW